MACYNFSHEPREVPFVRTRFRNIQTRLPAPESLPVLRDLEKYECRSMHGQYPVVWDRASNFQVWDRAGNCWIDFTSTIFVANAGHANPEIKKALKSIIEHDLLHSYTFATQIRADYLKKLIEFVPEPFEKAFLLSSGTEATECAIKLIRMWGKENGKSRGGIISFEDSMHGRTMGAQMLGGNPDSRSWIGFDDPNIHRLPFPYPWYMVEKGKNVDGAELFERDVKELLQSKNINKEQDISGFIIESYIGWGAVFFPKDYIEALVEFARDNNIIVCFDEIQGGFGRTGKLFAYQHYGVEPDLICCGKGMSSSLPLSAVIGRPTIMDIPEIGSMSSTHSAHPLSCAAGLANIGVIEKQDLVSEAARKGDILFKKLYEIQKTYPKRIRYSMGKGLVAALLFYDPDTGLADGTTASRICERAMQKGLLLVHTGRESIKLGPPLTIPDEALVEGLDVLDESTREIIGSMGK